MRGKLTRALPGRLGQVLAPLVLALATARPVAAQWAVEAFLGNSWSAPTDMTIRQQGYPDLRFRAHWETHPFQDAWYYAGRLSRWSGRSGWFVDVTHHKTYLENPPPEVQVFKITFGYNQFTVGKLWRRGDWAVSLGAGPVVTNAYSIVRNLERPRQGGTFGRGYELTGVTTQLGLNRRLVHAGPVFLSADTRLSVSWVRVPVVNGSADVPNIALHVHLGAGLGNPRRR